MLQMKQRAIEAVQALQPEYTSHCQWIHDHPELKFEEFGSSSRLQSYLADHGFRVEAGVGGLPTAFRAEYGEGTPKVALFCEYDALPGIGHGCGHNVIGTSSATAAIAAAQAAGDSCGGTIVVLGTPAEEGGGGKELLYRAGEMDDIDCAMMFHPGPKTVLCEPTLAICHKTYRFLGQGAHAAATPYLGRSALEAVIQMFNNVNSARPIFEKEAVVNGIITKGGVTTNIIPDLCECQFEIRAATQEKREQLEAIIDHCAEAAALSTGCRAEITTDGISYDELWASHALVDQIAANMRALEIPVDQVYSDLAMASTDMGNVSHHIPAVHCMFGVNEAAIPHTPQFASVCSGENAERMVGQIAAVLACTVLDLLADHALLARAKAELSAQQRQ